MPTYRKDFSIYYLIALCALSALIFGFLLGGCGDSNESGRQPIQAQSPSTAWQWFTTIDEYSGRKFRCIESVRDYALWCYEITDG